MRPLHRAVLAATTVVMCAPLGAQDVDWPGYHLTLDGHRFSTLGQIDVDNVARLREHCRLPIEAGVPFQGGLVVVAGVLYATTTHATVAMNAADCNLLWRHDYVPSEEEVSPPNRGAAVDGGRVFRGTADGRLLALDAAKGTLLWKHAIGNPRLGEFVSSAPIAWQGMVYVGIAGGDRGIRGRIMAYDAMTGREIWRFNTIPMGNEAGAETWQNPDTARTGGGGTWSSYSLDVTTGELFVPVGNPGPDLLGSYRPGNNLFTNSLLVLDAASGALKWHYQLTPADTRDLDLASPPVLYRDTARRDLAAVAGKDGYLVTLDRNTRLPLFKVPVTTIRNEGLPVTPQGNTYCPGAGGGTQWNGPAYDRAGSALIVGAVDWCFEVRSGEATYSPGAIFYGGSMRPMGDAKGWITAVDAATGAVRWRYASDAPIVAAITPTAGGLAFTGDMHGNFLALDSRTGAVRMKQATGGALAGGVVTYAVAGKQYVAVASGNVSRNTFGVLGTPTVIVYALPSEADGGVAGVGRGRDRYRSLCADCHGTDGALLSSANLQTVHQRRDAAGLRAYLKRPTPPMPKLYPEILDDAGVDDVARYLEQQLSRR